MGSKLTDQQREELYQARNQFLSSLRDFIDVHIMIGDVKPIRKLVATNSRFIDRHVKKLKKGSI